MKKRVGIAIGWLMLWGILGITPLQAQEEVENYFTVTGVVKDKENKKCICSRYEYRYCYEFGWSVCLEDKGCRKRLGVGSISHRIFEYPDFSEGEQRFIRSDYLDDTGS